MRGFAALAAVLLALAGCGDDSVSEPAAGSPPPAPADADAVLAAMAAMPGFVSDAVRVGDARDEARYELDGAVLGIEAIEIEDAFGADLTVEEAIELVRADMTVSGDCGDARIWCLEGATGAEAVTVWGSRDGGIMFAAIAPDAELRASLLAAWESAAG